MSYFRAGDKFSLLDEEEQQSLFGKLTQQTKKRYRGGVKSLKTDNAARQNFFTQAPIPDAATFNNIPTSPSSKSLLNTQGIIGPKVDYQKAAENFANAMQAAGKTNQMAAQGTKASGSFSLPGMGPFTLTKNAAGKTSLGINPLSAAMAVGGFMASRMATKRQNKQLAQINPVLEPGKRGEENMFSWYVPGDYS